MTEKKTLKVDGKEFHYYKRYRNTDELRKDSEYFQQLGYQTFVAVGTDVDVLYTWPKVFTKS